MVVLEVKGSMRRGEEEEEVVLFELMVGDDGTLRDEAVMLLAIVMKREMTGKSSMAIGRGRRMMNPQ